MEPGGSRPPAQDQLGVLLSRGPRDEPQQRCGDFNVLRIVCQGPNALSKPPSPEDLRIRSTST